MPELTLNEQLLNTASKDKWRRLGIMRRCGVLAPLFSFYSKNSIGIGDLDDFKLLIDWAKQSGNSILQLLPMNAVGAFFCPYDATSSFALEPLYLSLKALPIAKNKSLEAKLQDLRRAFPINSPYVDYRLKKEKINLLWKIFLQEENLSFTELTRFKEENAYWVNDFAIFMALKEYFGGKPWYEWEEKYKFRDNQALQDLSLQCKKEINFQIWLQWLIFKQFQAVRSYAAQKKILLKGDLPILISRDSADVWAHPELFKLEFAAGAPPDMYCALGQRWGMPTYNWENISVDRYRYFKEKLKYAENFYDILRVDHVVGLFRIWSIPYGEPLENQGLNGFFDPQDEHKWLPQGKTILSTMSINTNMLLCAEDLGVVPDVCKKTMQELGIPGNDVQRWVKDWKVRHDFLMPQEYRLLSVAMLSTQDTTNWPAWWENEAGTVDEGLFIRKCSDHRRIDFQSIRERLFDPARSRYGRLRWLESIDSTEKLIAILGKKKEVVADFIEMYENSYREKEKLWKHLNLAGPMRERADKEIVQEALRISLNSQAIFCINTIFDWLYLAGVFKGEPLQYRMNTPGVISEKNWSLRLPISLEELLHLKVNREIRKLIEEAGRI